MDTPAPQDRPRATIQGNYLGRPLQKEKYIDEDGQVKKRKGGLLASCLAICWCCTCNYFESSIILLILLRHLLTVLLELGEVDVSNKSCNSLSTTFLLFTVGNVPSSLSAKESVSQGERVLQTSPKESNRNVCRHFWNPNCL